MVTQDIYQNGEAYLQTSKHLLNGKMEEPISLLEENIIDTTTIYFRYA